MTVLRLVLAIAGAAYVAGFLTVLLFSDRMIFPAPRSSYARPGPDMEPFPGADGNPLMGLFLPLRDARYTVLYSHGNYEDLAWARPRMEVLRELGVQVFGYDYRGYGLSPGTASVANATADARAAYAYVRDVLGVPAEQIVLYGRSVGGGPSVALAVEEPVAGVILEATFTSAFRVVTQWPLLPFDRFRNAALISDIRAPLLLLHGRRDRVVAFRHGPALFAAAREPREAVWFDEIGHNDMVEAAPERYRTAVRRFLESLDAEPARHGASTNPHADE
jgi:fermentation-respiration switch protein FrsA (DUF1100 family)